MASSDLKIQKYYETFKEQALDRNSESVAVWSKYKTDLKNTKTLLNLLPKKISHDVMVPIGPKALMRGKIVHSNEFLVSLGETWFAKRTACQTIEICNRRIKTCDETLEKLDKERELILNKTSVPKEQEAFGSEEKPEIIEHVTEEEYEEWSKQHREKEKKYRKQLAELRNKEKKPIETEEDLWKHLDELELQEELEDELNRLYAEFNEDDDIEPEEEEDEVEEVLEKIDHNLKVAHKNSKNTNCGVVEKKNEKKKTKPKRKVSFACDNESSDDEPVIIHITHSKVEPFTQHLDKNIINCPSDIYDQYLISFKSSPVSVLKRSINPNKEKELQTIKTLGTCYSDNEDESETMVEVGLQFKDVVEKNNSNEPKLKIDKSKKISKFKASRMNQ